MAVDVLNFSSPTSFGPLSGFHSSAHLCLGATSQFSTTHVSMLLTDRDVRIVFGRQSFRVSSAVSLPVMACAPANVCKTASWIMETFWGFWYHNWWLNIWVLLQCGPWPVLSDQAILQFKFCIYLAHSILCIFFMTKLVLLVNFQTPRETEALALPCLPHLLCWTWLSLLAISHDLWLPLVDHESIETTHCFYLTIPLADRWVSRPLKIQSPHQSENK